jgi:hypothetical protein
VASKIAPRALPGSLLNQDPFSRPISRRHLPCRAPAVTGSVVWLNAALLATVAFAALLVPQLPPTQDAARATEAKGGVRGVGALLRLPLYRRLILIAALDLLHNPFLSNS